MTNDLFTIGHSNHAIDAFIALLELHRIEALADVRSQPYSRRFPDYSREALAAHLARAGVRYVFMGGSLGARPADPACYSGGAADFDLIRLSESFRRGIARLASGCANYRICLMCAEREPAECHRAILVGHGAYETGIRVSHILGDGVLEQHEDMLTRLAGGEAASAELFGTEDRIALSLRKVARRIAYRKGEAE